MSIHDLPTELVVHIASFAADDADINNLLRATRQLHAVLDTYLYTRNIERYNPRKHGFGQVYRKLALIRTAKAGGPVATFHKALEANNIKKSERTRKLADMAFKEAVFHGSADLIRLQMTLDDGLDVTKTTQYGRNMLYSPHVLSSPAVFRVLLESGRFDPFARDAQGMTVLFHAAALGKLQSCLILLELEGIDPDARDSGGATPLSRAAEGGHLDVMKVLLATGKVDINSTDATGFTPLKRAVKFSQTESVKFLLAADGIDADAGAARDLTLLQQAAANGMAEVVQILLGRGADVNEVYCGNTALTFAASAGRGDAARALLATEGVWINPNPPLVIGAPLLIACRRGHVAIVRALIEKGGVELDSPDRNKHTPLLYAVLSGRADIVRALVGTGLVNVNYFGPETQPALSIACKRGDLEVVQALLSLPSTMADMEDQLGRTPLDYAAENGHKQVIEELLEREEVALGSARRAENHPYEAAERRGADLAAEVLRPYYDRRLKRSS